MHTEVERLLIPRPLPSLSPSPPPRPHPPPLPHRPPPPPHTRGAARPTCRDRDSAMPHRRGVPAAAPAARGGRARAKAAAHGVLVRPPVPPRPRRRPRMAARSAGRRAPQCHGRAARNATTPCGECPARCPPLAAVCRRSSLPTAELATAAGYRRGGPPRVAAGAAVADQQPSTRGGGGKAIRRATVGQRGKGAGDQRSTAYPL